jgi:SAM-dependent methyltransferase
MEQQQRIAGDINALVWEYDQLPSGEPYDWAGAARGESPWDNIDFHVDIGCGRLKKGRFGIDRFPDEGVNWVQDLNQPDVRLPFPDDSIESIVSHHAMEHLDVGFIPLMDECHRVLKPGAVLRIVVPLFPSRTAVEDPDHKRYFMVGTFDAFCGAPDGSCWLESFSTPYTKARFEMVDKDYSPPVPIMEQWGDHDAREIRVALRKYA